MVLVDEGRIVAVGSALEVAVPDGAEVVAAADLTVAPGLIDLHTHGAAGVQVIDGTPDDLRHLSAFYARHGVTGFLAGVWGANEHIEAGIDAVVAALQAEESLPGAAILGIFLEGPFINPDWAGAFDPDTIMTPDVDLLERYLDRAQGHIKLLTLAPELPGAEDLIRLATSRGIVCALGHTGATWEQALKAAEQGVHHVTHTYNAMPSLHHRSPNALGAALSDDRFTTEIIADGVHVHPAAVRLLTRAKGAENVVLITDSIGATGLGDGVYKLRDATVTLSEGSARLANGTLAGSTLTMARGVANLVAFGAATLPEALAMGSHNAARIIGLDARKGRIAVGWDADLTALDADLNVVWTMVGGKMV